MTSMAKLLIFWLAIAIAGNASEYSVPSAQAEKALEILANRFVGTTSLIDIRSQAFIDSTNSQLKNVQSIRELALWSLLRSDIIRYRVHLTYLKNNLIVRLTHEDKDGFHFIKFIFTQEPNMPVALIRVSMVSQQVSILPEDIEIGPSFEQPIHLPPK